jgi:hypothetical protein
MKLEETTEFWLDWGEGQQLTVHEGLAMALAVLEAGPQPLQVGMRSTSYMALGARIPGPWQALFSAALHPAATAVETTFTARMDRGSLTQSLSLAPCEMGEHLHATVTLMRVVPLFEHDSPTTARDLLVEAWREVGDGMMELQDEWVHPFLEEALHLETLHGGS